MSPKEASTLHHGDVVLHQRHLYRVRGAFHHGHLLALHGRYMDPEVPSREVTLVWRKDEVPAGFAPGLLNAEEEAKIRAVIAARHAQEQDRATEKEREGER